MNFTIDCLEILPDCDASLFKNLKIGEKYFFNARPKDTLEKKYSIIAKNPNFWGDNINVQAIVGKNGSGKSSLMDLMYMAVNNFAYMFERGVNRPNADFLFYVKDLYVKLYYSFDKYKGFLEARGDEIELKVFLETDKSEQYDHVNRVFRISDRIEQWKSDPEIKKIVEPFFYTIVSNYSLQSFISSNYGHKCYCFNRTSKESDSPKNVDEDGHARRVTKKKGVDESSWIDSIFHKNDGYVRSIVLNPFRDKGKINMEVEKNISKYRLVSLLIDSKENGNPIIPGYSLKNIEYKLNEKYIRSKFWFCKSIKEITTFLIFDEDSILKEIDKIEKKLKRKKIDRLKNQLDILKHKLQYCKIYRAVSTRFPFGAYSSIPYDLSIMYLVYKIDKVVYSYPLFKDYRESGDKSLYGNKGDWFDSFLDALDAEHSHSVSKLKQTIHFLNHRKYVDKNHFVHGEDNLGLFKRKFSYSFYKEYMENSFVSLDEIIEQLPPPFFNYEVFLQNNVGKKICLNDMSSGELQLLATLSTHAYHIRNLMSVNESQIKYKNINLVFDEVEVCFHPEYQRIFIKTLTDLLKNISKDDYRFNVFIVTHSPFILSDIPLENILFMDNGKPDYNKKINPFAGNIGEMVFDSFFLKNSIGAFAEEKIKNIVRLRKGLHPIEERSLSSHEKGQFEYEKKVILENIGDPILKSLLD